MLDDGSTVSENQKLITIPIPIFPPFKLRSSLIDKDPVIWEYLLADYITLFKKLIAFIPYSHPKKGKETQKAPYVLSPKTINQLHEFILSFLHESSLESTQVFSLGAINPNIRQNQHLLKLAVFTYIKEINFVNLKLTGVSIWEFSKVYVSMANKYSAQGINQALVNISTIRKLIEGTVKSNYTSKSDDVSLIRSLQDYLGKLIASGKWRQEDTEILYSLLGQRTKKSLSNDNSQKRKNFKHIKVNKGDNSSDFAEKFVDCHWVQILSELYAGGEGVNSKTATQVMLISLCSLSSPKIVRLLKEKLEADTLLKLKQMPLIANIVLSKKFNDLNPDLKDMLLNLFVKERKAKSEVIFDDGKIQSVCEMFPQLSLGQVKTLLIESNHNVEETINKMLEMNLDDIPTIEDYDEKVKLKESRRKTTKPKGNKFEFVDKDKVYEVQMGKAVGQQDIDDIDKDYKKKILEKSLALLYQADEDEPDDTYLENETGASKIKMVDDGEPLTPSVDSNLPDKMLQMEYNTFGIYQSSPGLFKRESRKTPEREHLKKETGWTDEQIEGWARMLEKNPKRYRLLEEHYLFASGSLNSSGKKSQKWSSKKVEETTDRHVTDKRRGGRVFVPEKTPETKKNDNFQKYMEKKKQTKAKVASKKRSKNE
ncbi:hypothetical protein CANINC_002258 [Pichia inconspicua]|uniref:CUE domain-containing protein n=1 Tax=Pichia inconspicua TaxID=52247 RepID=A0A4T0X1Q0_9ASCO|nr:hypothetical protein CANINC_002258 [[Candida] inconspicua]